jgi:hypothetical protein
MIKPLRKVILKNIPSRVAILETAIQVLINSPSYTGGDKVGFNSQTGRKMIFTELLSKYSFFSIIETGTYLGDTTGYMAETSKLPVFTCEINETLHSLARMRLKDFPSIQLYNLDSRAFLQHLSDQPEIVRNECFVYLDAHWDKDLPLGEEVSIIASRWEKFVVMIDDFQVPLDEGYVYDRYGFFTKLNLSLLRPALKRHNLCAFFPTMPSSEESRPRPTGCVILARNNDYADPLRRLPSVRNHPI